MNQAVDILRDYCDGLLVARSDGARLIASALRSHDLILLWIAALSLKVPLWHHQLVFPYCAVRSEVKLRIAAYYHRI